ncbi:ABC transporter permease [Falsirhodobacter sp. 1013]|uniref:ABC transporter permease n=1 Tax=Falsirhodobacter sp. 1013 TaxID=3417566 RepID=UPI003EC0F937
MSAEPLDIIGGSAQRAGRLARLQAGLSSKAWLMVPSLLLLFFLFLVPLVAIIGQSFASPDGTFDAYRRILTSGGSLASLFYTFRVAVAVTLLSLILAYPVAYFIANARATLQLVLISMVLVPFWTSAVIRSYSWLVMLQRKGVVNDVLLGVGLIDRPLRLANTELGVHLAMVQVMLPFMALPLINAMRNINPGLMLAASILGANPLKQFLQVYLPLSGPGVLAGSALVFITTLGFYITPALLGGDGMMVAVMIEQQASRQLDWPLASALATLLLVSTCVFFLVIERLRAAQAAFRRPR